MKGNGIMGIILKGIEIENFKSYTERQYIHFSDLSVLLGANSSGKSTALQAILVMKQTLECNSPDEELLLSGKYVALGDFDDVISDKEKKYFVLSLIMEQIGKSENTAANDQFKISWRFKCAEDGMSTILDTLEIIYENINLSFKRTNEGFHNMYISEERSPFSVKISNLVMAEFYIHYDTKLNDNAISLLNELSRIFISRKTAGAANNRPVCFGEIDRFYIRLLDKIQRGDEKSLAGDGKRNQISKQLCELIDGFGKLVFPRYKEISQLVPKELCSQLISIALSDVEDITEIEQMVKEHEHFIERYNKEKHNVEAYEGRYNLGHNPFARFDNNEEKEDRFTQLKYALDFYRNFLKDILSKVFFVGPIRENPKGLYNIGFETNPKYVGPTGSYFASVLLHENKKERKYILPRRVEKCTLLQALAEWMVHLNVANAVNVDKKNSFGFSVSVENMEQVKSDIMNVGIGTSQVLPVLISVLLSEPGEILVFEQPELHLHPYSQSRLADMFVEFCKYGRKIILETHSDYFLLRLRYQIVKENILNECVAVNFFRNAGGTKVTFANISGFGNIEYPEDFKDETQELLNAILEASLERKGLL